MGPWRVSSMDTETLCFRLGPKDFALLDANDRDYCAFDAMLFNFGVYVVMISLDCFLGEGVDYDGFSNL
jgi:hypothetical protein